jgi:hypothetical protein
MNLAIIQTESNREIQRNYLPIQKFEREASDRYEFIMVLKLVEFLITKFLDPLYAYWLCVKSIKQNL